MGPLAWAAAEVGQAGDHAAQHIVPEHEMVAQRRRRMQQHHGDQHIGPIGMHELEDRFDRGLVGSVGKIGRCGQGMTPYSTVGMLSGEAETSAQPTSGMPSMKP